MGDLENLVRKLGTPKHITIENPEYKPIVWKDIKALLKVAFIPGNNLKLAYDLHRSGESNLALSAIVFTDTTLVEGLRLYGYYQWADMLYDSAKHLV